MPEKIDRIVRILKKTIQQWKTPSVGIIAEKSRDPYQILISCLISLRTKDDVTNRASQRLFQKASTPQQMIRLSQTFIEKLIYPAGFYRTKAQRILEISKDVLQRFGGKIPDHMEDLLSLKGVGRKTANLVLTLGFDQDGICVDIHVHRISNRLGLVKTKNPYETEQALQKVLPRRDWKIINDLLVPFGQNLCRPISPFCSRCPIVSYCKRIGVAQSR